jgi:N-acetyl-anhydromuramyl-L-alanine amidase AmpD
VKLAYARKRVNVWKRKRAHAQKKLDEWNKRAKTIKDALDKQPTERALPNVVVRRNVVNQSSRTASISLIVLHDTEGANIPGIKDLQALGAWFDNASAQASAHVGVDAEGQSARFVDDGRKAWHCAAFNSQSLGIEQIGFASQLVWPDAQLRETARWIAVWSKKYRIPITFSTTHGVCRHSDLGAAGGGHHDPGQAYPFEKVLTLAQHYKDLQ